MEKQAKACSYGKRHSDRKAGTSSDTTMNKRQDGSLFQEWQAWVVHVLLDYKCLLYTCTSFVCSEFYCRAILLYSSWTLLLQLQKLFINKNTIILLNTEIKTKIKDTGSKFFKQEASNLEYPIVFMYKCYSKTLSRPAQAFQTHSSSERKNGEKKNPVEHKETTEGKKILWLTCQQ